MWDQAVTHRENTDSLSKMENELGELTVQDDTHNRNLKSSGSRKGKCRTGKVQSLMV